MQHNKLIKVFEYDELKVSTVGFQQKHFDALVKFNEQHQNKYFDVGFRKITMKSYVGVIQVDRLTIEILPKADKSEGNKDTWQKVLLHMLKECRFLSVDYVSESSLDKHYHSILEAYFELYLKQLEVLIKQGLIKGYQRKQSNQPALKGKLVFARHIQKNFVHKERFYCEHQIYNHDHLMHQILLQGLLVLNGLNHYQLQDKINRLLLEFEGIKQVRITKSHFNSLKFNRKSESYRKAIEIAKMLILNYSPDITSGNTNMLTLLFDMNELWERYIFRVLYQYSDDYKVTAQNSKPFWNSKRIKPDIIITDKHGQTYILDTKWKVISSNSPSDADLRQIFAYNLLWNSAKSLLLYPKTDQEDSQFGNYHYPQKNDYTNQCKTAFISVIDGDKIKDKQKLSKEIFAKFEI